MNAKTVLMIFTIKTLLMAPSVFTLSPNNSLTPNALAQAPTLRANGKIAYTSNRDGNLEIYAMNADGTNQTRLTNNPGVDDHPAFSPDGRKIAFLSQNSSGAYTIKLMNADGTNQTDLTSIDHDNYQYPWHGTESLSWSPDGNRIAFEEGGEIYIIKIDGSNRTNLTNHPAFDYEPSWSPDGARIIFASTRVFFTLLHTMKTDGSDVGALPSDGDFWDQSPDWSPNGNKIVFVAHHDEDLPIIYTANADGANRQIFDRYTCNPVCSQHRNKPKWSPDGMKIVFHSWDFSSDDAEIYVKNVDGSGFAQLTNTAGSNFNPSWQPLVSSSGALDLTFGTGGKVVTNLSGGNEPDKMAIQPDGKIVVQGRSYTNNYSDSFLVRYNPNGTLDTNFGTGGKVVTPYQAPTFEYFTDGLAILPDGKILVSGCVNNCAAFAVFRFNGDGSRDASFGVNGVAVASSRGGINLWDEGRTLRVQPDGRIVVVGAFFSQCDDTGCNIDGIGAARFNADGSVDTAFGNGGKLVIPPSTANNFWGVDDLAVLPDGKLLLIGSRRDPAYNRPNVFLSRINANGTLDASFGTNGILLPQTDPSYDISKLAIQPDGKILFAAFNGHVSPTYSTIVRLNADGSFNASFGANGKVVIPNTEGVFYRSILIQSNGKILAGGGVGTSGTFQLRFAILRLHADGSRDASFGSNGTVTTLMASYGGLVSDLALQPDGKLVACGWVQNYDSDPDIGLARYDLDAPRRTLFDFDGDGKSDISVFRSTDRVWYVNRSTQGFSATQFGLSTDKTTPADFDGDGRADIAVYRDGTWYLLRSTAGFAAVQFGLADDVPQPADFDGDGRAELAVYRGGNWFTLNLSNNQFQSVQFGLATDKPIVGDYDGDDRADYAVYRDGVWYLLRSSQGFAAIHFGLSTDRLVPADYDDDGRTDLAVYRDGIWYLLQSSQGFTAFQFGLATDIPVPADYDGDGRADAAVYREGNWYLRQSANGFSAQQFGLPSDKPVPTAYLP